MRHIVEWVEDGGMRKSEEFKDWSSAYEKHREVDALHRHAVMYCQAAEGTTLLLLIPDTGDRMVGELPPPVVSSPQVK